MYPGAVRNHIHAIEGKNHAAANRKPVEKALSLRCTATEPYNPIPIKPSGHQPHGGIDAATNNPATRRRNELRLMLFTNEGRQGEQVLLRLQHVLVARMRGFRYLCNLHQQRLFQEQQIRASVPVQPSEQNGADDIAGTILPSD